jgi:hypothetical protein
LALEASPVVALADRGVVREIHAVLRLMVAGLAVLFTALVATPRRTQAEAEAVAALPTVLAAQEALAL